MVVVGYLFFLNDEEKKKASGNTSNRQTNNEIKTGAILRTQDECGNTS
jgi:hypothetical protein